MPKVNLPLALNARGADVVYLHVSLSKLGYTVPKHELDEQVFGIGTRDALLTLQAKYHLPCKMVIGAGDEQALGYKNFVQLT